MRRYEGTVPELLAAFFDWRRTNVARRSFRPSPSLDELAARRRQQNPRLSQEWLRYFAAHGAREVEGGWVWKVDPYAARGFGPWRPEWIAPSWRDLRMPMLAVWGDQPDTWGLPDPFRSERLALRAGARDRRRRGRRPLHAHREARRDGGARARPSGARVKKLASGRYEIALHELRAARSGPTLLALHALGGSARDFTPLGVGLARARARARPRGPRRFRLAARRELHARAARRRRRRSALRGGRSLPGRRGSRRLRGAARRGRATDARAWRAAAPRAWARRRRVRAAARSARGAQRRGAPHARRRVHGRARSVRSDAPRVRARPAPARLRPPLRRRNSAAPPRRGRRARGRPGGRPRAPPRTRSPRRAIRPPRSADSLRQRASASPRPAPNARSTTTAL